MKRIALTLILICSVLLLAACDGRADNTISEMNRLATQAAGGDPGTTDGAAEPEPAEPTPTPEPTEPPNRFDLTANPNSLLASPWGTIYGPGVASGEPFTIIATEDQVGRYIVQTLQQDGFIDEVRGGSAQIGEGQMRIDLALVDEDGDFGSGTVTFQPTLQGSELRLNPSPANFGALDMPGDFFPAIGDAVTKALVGAATANLQQVNVTSLTFENGVLTIEGVKR